MLPLQWEKTQTKEEKAMQCQKLKTYMETGRVVFLPARAIRPNPAQPRKVFSEEQLQQLRDSISQHGILQPLSVRRIGSSYELIAGERRLRAAQMAGLTEIPCIVMTMDEKESSLAAMVENLQRQDLDFVEEAKGLSLLMEKWGMSQEQLAKILGMSQSAIANKLRLLRHSPAVLDAILRSGLSERHARALLRIPTDSQKFAVIATVSQLGMSVAKTESYIEKLLQEMEAEPKKPNITAFLHNLTQSLSKIQLSGIPAISERKETDSQIVLTITIPK
jgi:ParB family chromosome partitioning protein